MIPNARRLEPALLFHACAERRVAVFLAIPEKCRRHLVGAGLFHVDRHDGLFLLKLHFFQAVLFEGQIDDDELAFRSRRMPGFGSGAVDDQQRNAAAFGNIGGELSCNFRIAISEKTGEWILDFKIVLRFIQQWILAVCRYDYVFNAVSVQIGLERSAVQERASRSELLLNKIVVNDWRRRWRILQRRSTERDRNYRGE